MRDMLPIQQAFENGMIIGAQVLPEPQQLSLQTALQKKAGSAGGVSRTRIVRETLPSSATRRPLHTATIDPMLCLIRTCPLVQVCRWLVSSFNREPDRVGARMHIQGLENRTAMHLYGPLAQIQLVGDLLVELSSG
jgi:hypothetical protein